MTDEPTDPKVLQAAHDEATASCRWAFVTILSVSLFCLITVFGKADWELLVDRGEITLPVINFTVDYAAFIVFSPILLVSFLIYLIIYLDLAARNRSDKIIVRHIIFNMDKGIAGFVSMAILYWLVPVVLAVITWETWPMAAFGWPILVFTLLVAVVLSLIPLIYPSIHKYEGRRRSRYVHAGINLVLVLVFIAILGQFLYVRSWELRRSELEKLDLSEIDLSFGDLERATLLDAILTRPVLNRTGLKYADLGGTIFAAADGRCALLTDAKLDKTSFEKATLSRSEFTRASGNKLDMNGAFLEHTGFDDAILPEANFDRTNLYGVRFARTKLPNARFGMAQVQAVDFRSATLDSAHFNGATLESVTFTGASLDKTDFTSAWFAAVDLRGTDISKARITYPQLTGAFCDASTIFPWWTRGEMCPNKDEDAIRAEMTTIEELPACPERTGLWLLDYLKREGIDINGYLSDAEATEKSASAE